MGVALGVAVGASSTTSQLALPRNCLRILRMQGLNERVCYQLDLLDFSARLLRTAGGLKSRRCACHPAVVGPWTARAC